MKKIAIKGSLELQKAFCKESGISYFQSWDERDYEEWPHLYTESSIDGQFNGCNDNWILHHDDFKVFNLPLQWDEALAFVNKEIKVKFGDFTAEIDKEAKRVIIADRGYLSFSQCNKIYDKIRSEDIGYTIKLNITSVDFGCVKNVPIEDVLNVIELINEEKRHYSI